MGQPVKVASHSTLDDDVRRFEVNRWVTGMGGGLYFDSEISPDMAPRPPRGSCATRLLEIEGIRSVYLYGNEITVTKDPGARWDSIDPAVTDVLEKMFLHYTDERRQAV